MNDEPNGPELADEGVHPEPEPEAIDNDWRRLARTDDREPYRYRWGRDVA